MLPAITCDTSVTGVLILRCAADMTGQYVRQLLEPTFSTVPAAAEIPDLFQSALHMSGTPPFPVPDVFYHSQWLQDNDMKHYLAPVSQSGAVAFSSAVILFLSRSSQTRCKQVSLTCMFGLGCWHTRRLVIF